MANTVMGTTSQRDHWIVIGSLRPGGAESAVRNMVAGLPQDIRDRTRVVLLNDSAAWRYESELGIPIDDLGASSTWLAAMRLRRRIRAEAPVLVQAHLTQCIVAVGLALVGCPGRLFVIVHTFGSWKQRPALLDQIRISLERWVVNTRAERVIYVSRKIRTLHESILGYPTNKGLVLPNILQVQKQRRAFPRAGPLRWISVGRLEPVKGFDWVLASPIIRSRLAREHWTIVGDGSQLNNLRQSCSGLAGLSLVGYQDNVPELLRAHDVFVLPSRSEGLSVALLEACRAGMPLIATRVGSNDEIVLDGFNGRLVDVGDDKALDRALSELENPALRAEWGKRSHALFHTRYDPTQLMNRLVREIRDGDPSSHGRY